MDSWAPIAGQPAYRHQGFWRLQRVPDEKMRSWQQRILGPWLCELERQKIRYRTRDRKIGNQYKRSMASKKLGGEDLFFRAEPQSGAPVVGSGEAADKIHQAMGQDEGQGCGPPNRSSGVCDSSKRAKVYTTASSSLPVKPDAQRSLSRTSLSGPDAFSTSSFARAGNAGLAEASAPMDARKRNIKADSTSLKGGATAGLPPRPEPTSGRADASESRVAQTLDGFLEVGLLKAVRSTLTLSRPRAISERGPGGKSGSGVAPRHHRRSGILMLLLNQSASGDGTVMNSGEIGGSANALWNRLSALYQVDRDGVQITSLTPHRHTKHSQAQTRCALRGSYWSAEGTSPDLRIRPVPVDGLNIVHASEKGQRQADASWYRIRDGAARVLRSVATGP